MLEILLIRHGQTDWNRDRRIMGRLPVPLNAAGRREVEQLSHVLRDVEIDAIYTSPLKRAVETAGRLLGRRGGRVILAPDVAEIDYGQWVGKTFDEVRHEENYLVYHTRPSRAKAPGGERMIQVYRRTGRFIERLRKKHREGRVVVVSHADVIKAILVRYLKLDLNDLLKIRIDNCSLSSLWFNGSRCRVLGVNCHARLGRFFLRTDQLVPPLMRRR